MFGSWEELVRVGEELAPERRSLPVLVAGTGLRPEEWLALERRDLDLKAGVLHVRRVYTDGRVKDVGKQERSLRRIPLRARVVEALESHPWRIGTPLVYPDDNGEHLNLHDWRCDEWRPALDSAGPSSHAVLDASHVRVVRDRGGSQPLLPRSAHGSSAQQIDRTYGHMLPRLQGLPPRSPRCDRRGPCLPLCCLLERREVLIPRLAERLGRVDETVGRPTKVIVDSLTEERRASGACLGI